MLNPSYNQFLVFSCVAVITGAPFYFRYWVAKNKPQPSEVDRKVSRLTALIFAALFLGAFVFSAHSRASGEVLLAAAILSFSILYRSRWAHLSSRTQAPIKIKIQKEILVRKMIFFGLLSLVALICSRFPLGAPLFILSFPFLAPYSIRLQNSCQLMASSELRAKIFGVFRQAGVRLQEVYLIDSAPNSSANAMLAGRSLFLTVSLFEQLNEAEVLAVVFHEAAHLREKHLWKRLFSASIYLVLGMFWTVLPMAIWFPGNLAASVAAIFSALGIQLFFLGRKIYQQELEADRVGIEMGGSSDALCSALRQLSPGTDPSPNASSEMNGLTRFFFGVYHPSAATRIQAIQGSRGVPRHLIFPKKQYFAAYSFLVLGFVFHSAQTLAFRPYRSLASVPSPSAKISHAAKVATRR